MTEVVEVCLRDLPRTSREQVMFILAQDGTVSFQRTEQWMCAMLAVPVDHPVLSTVMPTPRKPTVPTWVDDRLATPPRSLRRNARSRSAGRSPSPLSKPASPTVFLRRGEQRTVQWASRLVEEMLVSCNKSSFNTALYTDVVDLTRSWLNARCGISSMSKETLTDLLNAAAFYRRWCPTCRFFDDLRTGVIRFNLLNVLSQWRSTMIRGVVTESQRVWTGKSGYQIVLRRYLLLERLPDTLKQALRSTTSISSEQKTDIKAAVLRFVQCGDMLKTSNKGQSIIASHTSPPPPLSSADDERITAFDYPGYIDLYELLRVMTSAACTPSASQKGAAASLTSSASLLSPASLSPMRDSDTIPIFRRPDADVSNSLSPPPPSTALCVATDGIDDVSGSIRQGPGSVQITDGGAWTAALRLAQQRSMTAGSMRAAEQESAPTRISPLGAHPPGHTEAGTTAFTADEADLFCELKTVLERHKLGEDDSGAARDRTPLERLACVW